MPRLIMVLRRRYRLVLALSLVVFLLSLGGAALTPRKYTAQAQVIAGQIGVSAAAVPSYAVAAESLAQTFSRVFDGDAVQQRISDMLGPADAQAVSVDASPVPATSVILIEAIADTPGRAAAAADAGAEALIDEVGRLLDSTEYLEQSAERFADASRRFAAAQAALTAAEADLAVAQEGRGGAALEAAQRVVVEQAAAVSTAQAEVEAYRSAIANAAGNTDAANAVQPLAAAQVVSDNGSKRFELLGLTGLVAGTLLGVGAGYLAEIRLLLREERNGTSSRRRRPRGVNASPEEPQKGQAWSSPSDAT